MNLAQLMVYIQYRPEVTLQSLASTQIQATTQHNTQLEYITCESARLLEQPPEGACVLWLTCGELVSTHMPKKSRVKNWLHEYQLLVSVTLPLGGTVCTIPINNTVYRFYITDFVNLYM